MRSGHECVWRQTLCGSRARQYLRRVTFASAYTIAISTNSTGGFRPVVSESSTQNVPESRRLLAHATELVRSALRFRV